MTIEGTTRRDLLRRGALIGGATVWAVPAVQALSMAAAHAEPTSNPTPVPTPSPSPIGGGGGGSGGGNPTPSPTPSPIGGGGGGNGSGGGGGGGGGNNGGGGAGGRLPRTGFEVGPLLGAGAAATAAGVGLVALGKHRSTDEPGDTPA